MKLMVNFDDSSPNQTIVKVKKEKTINEINDETSKDLTVNETNNKKSSKKFWLPNKIEEIKAGHKVSGKNSKLAALNSMKN